MMRARVLIALALLALPVAALAHGAAGWIAEDRLKEGIGPCCGVHDCEPVTAVLIGGSYRFIHAGRVYETPAEDIFETFNPGAVLTAWACFTSSGEVRVVTDAKGNTKRCVIVPRTGG